MKILSFLEAFCDHSSDGVKLKTLQATVTILTSEMQVWRGRGGEEGGEGEGGKGKREGGGGKG